MIIPAILEQTPEAAEALVRKLDPVAPIIQIDIADGVNVEGKTFLDVRKISKFNTKAGIQLHLMVENPLKIMGLGHKVFGSKADKIQNVNMIYTQINQNNSLEKFLHVAKEAGYRVGISLKPEESWDAIKHYLGLVSAVQFLSVIPGKQGGVFIPAVLDKIRNFKSANPGVVTQIDGGVDEVTLPSVLSSGVDNIVVGSAIIKSTNPMEKFLEFVKTAYGSNINS